MDQDEAGAETDTDTGADVVRRGRVRAAGWASVTPGYHCRHRQPAPAVAPDRPPPTDAGDPGPGPLTTYERHELLAWQAALPDGAALTGLTAARVRGWWLPELPDDLPVFAAVRRGDGRVRRAGLRVSRLASAPVIEVVDGLRLTTAGETLLACATLLDLLDLLVVVDGALVAGVDRDEIATAAQGDRRKGAPLLRRALSLADERSESPWETTTRLFCVVVDVPVEVQHRVVVDGVLLARGDLRLAGTTTLLEYDGATHLGARRYRDDRRRDRRLGRAGWSRIGCTRDDLVARSTGLLRDVDTAVAREHDPGRVRPWHDLLRRSASTPAGRAWLRARWSPPPRSTVGGSRRSDGKGSPETPTAA